MNMENQRARARPLRVAAALLVAAWLAGCASTVNHAPVEDRSPAARVSTVAPTAVALPDSGKPLPGAENAGKPGYYSVKPSDTLIRIGLDNGQHWKDLVKWNNIENPNIIEVGQVLRVVPPGVDPTLAAPRGVSSARVEPRPLDGRAAASSPAASSAASGAVIASPAATPAASAAVSPVAAASVPAAPREADDDVNWAWPASGPVMTPFDDARSKGLAIGGKVGDPVLAAADGRVVYAGSGLRGYGNLLILKHNSTYLTAYAHNQTLLVKEDQAVRRGQKIAEMGSTDAERVQLHFEIRRQGKPIDPAKLLPPR